MRCSSAIVSLAVLATSRFVLADATIGTSTFYTCDNINATVIASNFSVSYSQQTQNITFDLAGTSVEQQNVTATISVSAYGKNLFNYTFHPCDYGIKPLCPVPSGTFSASGSVAIPSQYASQVPSIAFSLPDLDGYAKLTISSSESQEEVGCFQSSISNGKTARQAPVTYASAAIAGAALAVSSLAMLTHAALSSSSSATSGSSPGFADVVGWTQSMAMNGMMSVNYPTVYKAFSQNFGWSLCMIPWSGMQQAIDTFRSHTGGNTTLSSWEVMQASTVLDYQTGAVILVNNTASNVPGSKLIRRLTIDGINLSASNSTTANGSNAVRVLTTVQGIGRYVEHLMLPNANTFMTVLIFFAIILGVVICSILLFRIALELWAQFGSLSKGLESFRRRYWLFMGSTIVRVILILYGTWVLYCLYQFKLGDSWASLLLASITLGIFTAVIGGFTLRIFWIAHKASKQGGIEELYEHKPWIRRYGVFYGQFKTQYWWFFVMITVIAVGRSAFIALGDGHGLVQVVGQLALEIIFVLVLFAIRPFSTRSANIINAIIAMVRIASLVCVLIFVEELGVAAVTTTIVGVVLIVMQAVLTALLALLILIQAIVVLLENPQRKQYSAVEETELRSLSESKADLLKRNDSYNLELKASSDRAGSSSNIGVAISEYDHLAAGTGFIAAKRGRMAHSTPWDENADREELVPTAHSVKDLGLAADEPWARAGLERDKNGRPIF
ncbi:hypothetical protein V1525DRAFT_394987 [Lipomyces kononenkoae]|uniref:Uncharacterized protein n=1 Tax=Lipomyces kononenkoae TaxID=34357 RepID=A0ACC3T8Z2_LIPKO